MNYNTINLPYDLDLSKMGKKELLDYAKWFHDSMQTRISELSDLVICSVNFVNWKADYSPESLEELGKWFEGKIEYRKRSQEEINKIASNLTISIDIPNCELTDRSFSISIDVARYFSQVILSNLKGTRWDQFLKKNKYVDYGHPVIMGFGRVPLNPVRVIINTAYGILDGKPANLKDLYFIWAKMLG